MAVICGVDLGGTKIQTVALRGEDVAGQARTETPMTGGAAVVKAMADTVHEALAGAKVALTDVDVVGVGSPGQVDTATGIVRRAANVGGLEDEYALGPELSKALSGVRVVVDNDVRVATLGEYRRGAGRPFRNLIGVFVGTGVGGGLVLDGTLRTGRGAAGEIGHTTVVPDGRRCGCGRKGCLEAYAGRRSIEEAARRAVDKGRKTDLFKIMEHKGRDRVTSSVIEKALRDGDKLTIELIDEAVSALGAAVANAQNLLDVEAVMIGGGLGDRLGQPFVDRVAEAMQPNLFAPDRPPAMITTQFGDLGGAIGAAVNAAG